MGVSMVGRPSSVRSGVRERGLAAVRVTRDRREAKEKKREGE